MFKIFITLLLLLGSSYAATFNVSTTAEFRQALLDAAQNGQDDTIILADGIYKTTDDGVGTFIYFSNEANQLTLQGSSSANVILSGDSQHQILNHNSTKDAPFKLEKLSFLDGNNTVGYGGGVYTDYSLDVIDCNFKRNTASDGGGFYAKFSTVNNSIFSYNVVSGAGAGFNTYTTNYQDYTKVNDSTFTNNTAGGNGGGFYTMRIVLVNNSVFNGNNTISGGGFYTDNSTEVNDSTFANNTASANGGGFLSKGHITVDNSSFTGNSAGSIGGGLCTLTSYSNVNILIMNSIFSNNTAENNGGGFFSSTAYFSDSITVHNSIFYANLSHNGIGAFYANVATIESPLIISNVLVSSNSSGIYLGSGENSVIYNSIFLDNNDSDINGGESVIISHLENNYLDTSKLTVANFASNNIFDGVTPGFADEVNGDYTLTVTSDLIDAGTTTILGFTLPTTDLNGNTRVVSGNIDIGPYEYQSNSALPAIIMYLLN